jgi:tRNA threonylcarbamoyladenosine biosynthesis protein TsaE
MATTIHVKSLEEISGAAEEFIRYVSSSPLQSNVFAFFGQMGAGKTTFIKALCNALGVEDDVNSPTFTIVNEYRSAKGFPVYHFDFYRINSTREAYDIGIDEYFGGEGISLIEWSEKIEALLPDDVMTVKIEVQSPTKRRIEID